MTTNTEKRNCILGRAAVFATTLIWGSSFVILKNTINAVPTFYILALRFTGAAILMFLFGVKELKKLDTGYLKSGVIMGVLLFAAYTFQTYGLELTTPGKNAFLTSTYCIAVPFLYWAIEKKRPHKYNVIAAVVCMVGVGLVSIQKEFTINMGDVLTICCGVFFALHIIATSRYAKNRSVLMLSAIQLLTAGLLGWVCAVFTTPFPQNIGTNDIWSLVYLCVMCSAACYALQTYGQKHTPPSSTALIMTLESVFGAVISIALGYEGLTIPIMAGFVLIFMSVVISETKLSFLKKKRADS